MTHSSTPLFDPNKLSSFKKIKLPTTSRSTTHLFFLPSTSTDPPAMVTDIHPRHYGICRQMPMQGAQEKLSKKPKGSAYVQSLF
jgi:hypothetical protein